MNKDVLRSKDLNPIIPGPRVYPPKKKKPSPGYKHVGPRKVSPTKK